MCVIKRYKTPFANERQNIPKVIQQVRWTTLNRYCMCYVETKLTNPWQKNELQALVFLWSMGISNAHSPTL